MSADIHSGFPALFSSHDKNFTSWRTRFQSNGSQMILETVDYVRDNDDSEGTDVIESGKKKKEGTII